ncbi:2OG-Fe(II) oxygenase [Rhizobacter sp. AJA081-3]|uniref:2OG-Fe(II) oxygenase n=1 Tax=Rhizobacter sp. AJA081-3 TaxID=2753607 RepID=UPI001ADEFF0A|nr:2OG-Fe(II) oxygenase [Rhizobacter sp. AJA081-3]QTN25676.1 2OG-Fe(II) oxygenase [Rhizobacter sp. AJA081-3]
MAMQLSATVAHAGDTSDVWLGSPVVQVFDNYVEMEELRTEVLALHDSLLPADGRGAAVWHLQDEAPGAAPQPIRALAWRIFADAVARGVRAIEYWSNTIGVGHQLPAHIDKDEGLYRRSGVVVSPVLTAVYYADVCVFTGGQLDVEGILVKPRQNRLVMFDGCLSHQVRRVRTGVRRSLVLNAWRSPPSP